MSTAAPGDPQSPRPGAGLPPADGPPVAPPRPPPPAAPFSPPAPPVPTFGVGEQYPPEPYGQTAPPPPGAGQQGQPGPYAQVPPYPPVAGQPVPPPSGAPGQPVPSYPGYPYPPQPGGAPVPAGGGYAPPAEAYPPGQWQYGSPPYAPALPMDDRARIGPERVPWHWYDVLIAGWLFILIALSAFVSPTAVSDTNVRDTASRTGLSREAFLIANTVANVAVYAFVLLLIWWRSVQTYKVPWSALGVRKAPVTTFLLMIPVWLAMTLAAGGIGQLINQLFYGGKGTNPQIDAITGGGGFSWVALICAVLSASIAAPVVEELLFRGMLYGWLRTHLGGAGSLPGIAGAVALDAVIFAAAHGIGLILASIVVVGAVLAIVYERTKSTLVTMALHSLFNTVQLAVVFGTLATGGSLT